MWLRIQALAIAALLLAACLDDVQLTTTTSVLLTTTSNAATGGPIFLAPLGEGGPLPSPSDDPDLDFFAASCSEGDLASCDSLFFASPPDSEYLVYADSCGLRNEPAGLCVDLYTIPVSDPPVGLGDDPAQDTLANSCFMGGLPDCNSLWLSSEPQSAYWLYGQTCGLRNESTTDCLAFYLPTPFGR